MMKVAVLVAVCLSWYTIQADTCNSLGDFLRTLDQLIGDEKTGAALDAHPEASRADAGLAYCDTSNTCCSDKSEGIMSETLTEFFGIYSISMELTTLEDEIRSLRNRVLGEVTSVTGAADGALSGEASRRFVIDNDVDVADIAKYRLAHFLSNVYNVEWQSSCLEPLKATRTLMSERVTALLNQYKDVISGLAEGINKIPGLKVIANNGLSGSCEASLMRAGLHESLGCKACSDATRSVPTCYNLCINAARGCLRPLLCHNFDWVDWTNRQDKLITDLTSLASKRSAFIDALTERFELEYAELVRENEWNVIDCDIDLFDRNVDNIEQLKAKELHLPSLEAKLHEERFAQRLADLPNRSCDSSTVSDKNTATETDVNCWNGTAVGPYIHLTPDYTINDQKCNPEIDATQLSCDTDDMSCPGYEFETLSPLPTAPPATEGRVIIEKNSAASHVLHSLLLLLLSSLLLVV